MRLQQQYRQKNFKWNYRQKPLNLFNVEKYVFILTPMAPKY